MIVEFESYVQDVQCFGKAHSVLQLRQMYKQAKRYASDEPISIVFCRLYSFELLPYDAELHVDVIIDCDTDYIYVPKR